MELKIISTREMSDFVERWHYSRSMPRLTKVCVGEFRGSALVSAISFGWGSRPLHTIRALFPSLTTADYFEIGRMCLDDAEPRNSESAFIAQAGAWLRANHPQVKLLFTWADGMWGKPGYVYQASNFLYGGFIWTDAYLTADGKKLHPLQLQAERRKRGMTVKARTQRPSFEEQQAFGWKHYFGKQFRYIKFLCGHKERKRLLAESTIQWQAAYPKGKDCQWRVQAGQGSRVNCEAPSFESAVRFRSPAPILVEESS